MALTEAQKRAKAKYTKENYKDYKLRLNKKYDMDIIEHMEKQEKNAYLKELIRKDIESQKGM